MPPPRRTTTRRKPSMSAMNDHARLLSSAIATSRLRLCLSWS
ncbi:hypothetical protein P4123_10830 [Pseudomonas aeruginosa]|nr:hypothetical protein [Pseudomonas aeruginosa]